MVAITVILAAVIGTFVLGLGDSLGDSQPQAQLAVDSVDYADDNVTVAHNGGDSLQGDDLRVTVNGTEQAAFPSGSFGVGESKELNVSSTGITEGDSRLRIIHVPSESVILDREL